MVVEAGQAGAANDRHDKSSYDSASTAWAIGLGATLVGAGAAAVGGILFAVAGPKSGDNAHATRAPLWIGAGSNGLRLGGDW